MRLPSILLLLSSIGFNTLCYAATSPEELFQQALTNYEAKEYEVALEIMQEVVALDPEQSNYQHLLAKCYGRLAEQANFIKAMSLARNTLKALEKAVELDNNNIDALRDLMTYYRTAPGFLGGSNKKADSIEQQLRELNRKT